MNLLDKASQELVVFLSLLVLVACGDSGDTLLELEPGDDATEVLFETFDLSVSSVFMDSLRTDGGTALIVGANRDSVYGLVDVTSYVELDYRNGPIPSDTLEVERATFYMEITELQSQNIVLDQTIELRITREAIYESAIYLSDETLQTEEEVIGTVPVLLTSEDTLVAVDLDTDFTNLLWDNIDNNNNIASLDFGLALSGSDPTGGIASIDITADSTFIEFTSTNDVDSAFTTVFLLENQFHHVERDRSGSLTAGLTSTGDSLAEGANAYINSLAGIYTSIDLSPLVSFLENNSDAVINIARLELPIPENQSLPLAQSLEALNFFFGKANSGLINGPGLIDDIGNTVLAPEIEYALGQRRISARNVRLETEEERSSYDETISLFSQYLLERNLAGDGFITNRFIILPSARLSLDRGVISRNDVQLEIFYTVLRN